MNYLLVGLYAFAVLLSALTTGTIVWYLTDQRTSWLVVTNVPAGTASIKKRRLDRDTYSFKKGKRKCNVSLEPAKSLYKPGWRSGRIYFIDEAAGVQTFPYIDEAAIIEKPGWKLGALADSKIDEMLMRMRGKKQSLLDNPVIILALLGALVIIGIGVYR